MSVFRSLMMCRSTFTLSDSAPVLYVGDLSGESVDIHVYRNGRETGYFTADIMTSQVQDGVVIDVSKAGKYDTYFTLEAIYMSEEGAAPVRVASTEDSSLYAILTATVRQESIAITRNTSLNVKASGGNYSSDVESNREWTASSSASWCKATVNVAGGIVRYAIAENTSSSSRSCTVTVATTSGLSSALTVRITQAGAS